MSEIRLNSSGNPDTQHYLDKIQEMLTCPQFRKNPFLKSVLEWISENGIITRKQAEKIEEMDEV